LLSYEQEGGGVVKRRRRQGFEKGRWVLERFNVEE